MLLGSCRTASPLEAEFTAAARASLPSGSDDSRRISERDSPLAAFVRAHGVDAIDLYLDELRRWRHTHDHEGILLAEAAAHAIAMTPARADEPAMLRELAADEEAPASLRMSVITALAHVTGESVAGLLAARLLQEKDRGQRALILSRLEGLKDPGTVAKIQLASEKETDEGLRVEMQRTAKLLSTPEQCLLFRAEKVAKEWVCRYRCAGKYPMHDFVSSVECAPTIPNANNQ